MNIFAPRDDLFRSRRELNLGAKHGKRYFLPVTPDNMDAVHQVKVKYMYDHDKWSSSGNLLVLCVTHLRRNFSFSTQVFLEKHCYINQLINTVVFPIWLYLFRLL